MYYGYGVIFEICLSLKEFYAEVLRLIFWIEPSVHK